MNRELSYKQIIRALFSENIEEYVPDGTSVSHPVVDIRDGRIVDCFLLFASSLDKTRYTAPTSIVVIDSEKARLVEYRSEPELLSNSKNNIEFFYIDREAIDQNAVLHAEKEYQRIYPQIRRVAFNDSITDDEKKILARYISLLKEVELKHLQPFLFELGKNFFDWANSMII